MTRILFIPEVLEEGTSERTPALYRIMKANHDVFGLPAPWDRFIYDPARAKWPRYVLYAVDRLPLGVRGLSLATRCHVELVFCETAHNALSGLAIARILGIRCVWDSHGNVKLFSESVGKGWFFSRVSTLMERFLGRRVDVLVTVSEQDSEAYTHMGVPTSKIHVVPTCVDLHDVDGGRRGFMEGSKRVSDVPVLLFFGSFKYPPNLEALEFINASLGPYLERAGVPCEIHIAGRDIPTHAFHPFIKVLGFIPDIYACIRSADLCIVPVWKGVGILTKVLDIMATGTPAVISAFAASGTPGIQHGIHAYVAASEDEFLGCVADALGDPEACRSMAKKARQLIEEEYDWELQKPHLDRILRGGPPGMWQEG